MKVQGIIKFFDAIKGFGFIARNDRGDDVYFSGRDARASGVMGELRAGDRIAFEITDAGGGRFRATRIEMVEPASTTAPA